MKESEHSESAEQWTSKAWVSITGGLGWILTLGILMQLLWKTIDRFYILQ